VSARTVLTALALVASLVACQNSDVERHTIPAGDIPAPSPRRANAQPTATEEPSPTGASPLNANVLAPTTTADAGAAAGELTWTVPSKWTTAPNPSPMRKATYKIPKATGDESDAEMSVTLASGALDANIDRWSGQFDEAKTSRSERTLPGGVKVTIVEIKGTLKGAAMPMAGGPPTEPKKGWALLGAIAETPSGMTFFKMTGPAKTVTGARPEFDTLVASLKVR
jgi:hypothetical protein